MLYPRGVVSPARFLIVAGLALVALGLLLHFGPSVPLLGKLPGDVRIERPGVRIYIPITSCLLLSVVLSAVLWLFSRLR
jgi:hypothetical protein